MNCAVLPELITEMARSRRVRGVARTVVEGIAADRTVAVARIWLENPGDVCAMCAYRQPCSDHSRCLHLIASRSNVQDLFGHLSPEETTLRRVPIGMRRMEPGETPEGLQLVGVDGHEEWIGSTGWLQQVGIRAVVAVPLMAHGTRLGMLAIFDRVALTDHELEELRRLGEHLAGAIERARRAEKTPSFGKEHLSVSQSEQKVRRRLEALKNTMEALASEPVPERIVEHVLRTISEQLNAHSCTVWRRSEEDDMIDFEVALEGGKLVRKIDSALAGIDMRIPMERFWPELAPFQAGTPGVMEDIRELEYFPWKERLVAMGVITIMVVPMSIAGQVDAVIGIRFTEKRRFSVEEFLLVQALSNQAMLAMQLIRLSAQSREAAVNAERMRLARDIHDTLAQGFTGVIVQLEAAEDATGKNLMAEATEHLRRARALARDNLQAARRSVKALRPTERNGPDLAANLQSLVQKTTAGTSVSGTFVLEGAVQRLPPQIEENLLRVAQEALTNVFRHARARQFRAGLSFAPEGIRLELKDDGCGFDVNGRYDGFGLIGMRERVEEMGGSLSIASAPGQGARLLITLGSS